MTTDMTSASFAALAASSTALLTTYRRNGQGVGTPVGIRMIEGAVYFMTWTTTGKVKRMTRNPRVTLAPFTRLGMKATGPAVTGLARRLDGAEADEAATRLLKASLVGWMWSLIYRLRGLQPVFYRVTPTSDSVAAPSAARDGGPR